MTLFTILMYMNSFDLYIFDLDGTLIDTLGDIATALNNALKDLEFPPLTHAQVAGLLGFGTKYMMSGAMKTEDPSLLSEAALLFKSHYRKVNLLTSKPFPGMEQVLDTIKDRGSHLAVATNKPTEGTHQVLDGLGLTSMFDLIISGDTLSTRKPDPAGLLHILKHFNVNSDQAVMIGDMDIDIITGKRAGTATGAVTWGYGSLSKLKAASPDFTLERVEDILSP